MKFREFLKTFKWGRLFPAIFFCIVGILFLAFPVNKLEAMEIATGVFLLLSALLCSLYYIFGMEDNVFELLSGAAQASISVWLFFNGSAPVIYSIALSVVIVLHAFAYAYRAIRARTEDKLWILLIVFAVALVGLSIVIMVNPFALRRELLNYTGAVVLSEGAISVIFLLREGLFHKKKERSSDPRAQFVKPEGEEKN